MSEKQTQTVPVAAEQKLDSKVESAAKPQPKPFQLIEVPQLTKQQVATAKMAGFPLEKLFDGLNRINAYVNSELEFRKEVEDGFNKVGVAIGRLEPLVDLAERVKSTPVQSQPAAAGVSGGGGGGMQTLMDLLPMVLGKGGEATPNPFAQKAQDMALEALSADISLTKALKQFVLQKTAEKLTTEIVQKVG